MLNFTEKARERVLAFMEGEETPVALRVAVQAGSPLAPQYELALVDETDREPGDTVLEPGGFKVYVDERSAPRLEGATIDWVENLNGGGFNIENPNIRRIGSEAPTGELAEKVSHLIDTRINPAVASHGGHVTLVDVEDDVVYVQLSGGCQGCGMATVTLRQGIERMLREACPEIADVVDVTDHSRGTNPYYEAAR
jgi:Fe/S biogenesis protein NfuA